MFRCFKPVMGGDHASMIDSKHRRCAKYIDADERLITYASVREKKALVFPAIPSASVTSEKHAEDAEKHEELAGEELYEDSEEKFVAGRERHLIRRACRLVFLRVSCQKNMKESKSKFRTKHSNHVEEDARKLKRKLLRGDPQSDSNTSSSSWGHWSKFSSSTTPCSTSSSRPEGLLSSSERSNQSRDENLNKDQGQVQGQRCWGFTSGLCTVLVTLLVLIMWGKTCSVLCTCVWFFIVPSRNMNITCTVSKDKGCELSEEVLSSEGYKKRIVMEGLLRRERCMNTRSVVAASV